MYLSAEQKDLIAGFVNRQEVTQLIGYLESLERPQDAPGQPPIELHAPSGDSPFGITYRQGDTDVFGNLQRSEKQAEEETASAVAEAEKPSA